MTALFADTFYWVALADFKDSAHWRAVEIATVQAGSGIVTTDEVLRNTWLFSQTHTHNFGERRPKALRGFWLAPLFG
jgi:predicted nucleic acid-binding protein